MWELQAITAVIIGGTALTGGVGRIWGSICGAFILEIVGNIMICRIMPANILSAQFKAQSSSLRCSFSAR